MRRRGVLATATAGGILLTGCQGEYDVTREPAPVEMSTKIGQAATEGVWVTPYKLHFKDASVERSFLADENGEVSCPKVGEQRRIDISKLYAWDANAEELVQFAPPTSDDQIITDVEGITKDTGQCAKFDPRDGDEFVNEGIPVLGVFETGERKFVIEPLE